MRSSPKLLITCSPMVVSFLGYTSMTPYLRVKAWRWFTDAETLAVMGAVSSSVKQAQRLPSACGVKDASGRPVQRFMGWPFSAHQGGAISQLRRGAANITLNLRRVGTFPKSTLRAIFGAGPSVFRPLACQVGFRQDRILVGPLFPSFGGLVIAAVPASRHRLSGR